MPTVSASCPTLLNLEQLGADLGIDLHAAFLQLEQLYTDVDAQLARQTADLALPCRGGCSACCHQSVFLTPLEFLYAWRFVQANLSQPVRQRLVAGGLALYAQHRRRIDAFCRPADGDDPQRLAEATALRFRCPFLSVDERCQIHPARELLARLFGGTFLANRAEIYGCQWVADHLAGRQLTLGQAQVQARRLRGLPLTDQRQVYPYYFQLFFGS